MSKLIVTVATLLLFYVTWAATANDQNTKGMEGGSPNNQSMYVEKLKESMVECNESFRIEMSYIEAMRTSGSFPDETDKTPKCFVRCMLEKVGIASEDGKYDAQKTAIFFSGEREGKVMEDVGNIATTCSKRDEQCKCERAYQYMKCMMEKVIEKYKKDQ